MIATDVKDPIHIPISEAGHAKEYLARGSVDVDRKGLAVPICPLCLRIGLQIEMGIVGSGDLIGIEAVVADEPVGLVETMLANQGCRSEGEAETALG